MGRSAEAALLLSLGLGTEGRLGLPLLMQFRGREPSLPTLAYPIRKWHRPLRGNARNLWWSQNVLAMEQDCSKRNSDESGMSSRRQGLTDPGMGRSHRQLAPTNLPRRGFLYLSLGMKRNRPDQRSG